MLFRISASFRHAATALTALLASACTMTGTGIGNSRVAGASAMFSWSARGPQTGTMTAVLADGRSYAGPFFQITRETRVDDLGPLWTGWEPMGRGRFYRGGRGGWRSWGPSQQFIIEYSGKVLANLAGPGGPMRCRFTLMRPSSGMSGGGIGQCQLSDRTRIQATFLPH